MNTNRKVGQLFLVETKQKPEEGLLIINLLDKTEIAFCKKAKTEGFFTFGDVRYSFSEKSMNNSAICVIQPIIICDDKIKVGDKFINTESCQLIYTCSDEEDKQYIIDTDKKILVLPNQFSQEFLQAIVDGKVKDGDKVEVEMERTNPEEPDSYALYGRIKLRKDGSAIIHKYEETVEEALKRLSIENRIGQFPWHYQDPDDVFSKGFLAGVEWQKSQKK